MLHGIAASGLSGFVPPLSPIAGVTHGTARRESYAAQLSIADGTPPYSWSIIAGALPAGLTIDSSTGLISGVVDVAETIGYHGFTVRVEDSDGRSSQTTMSIGVGSIVSLLHLNGANAGTSFPDATGKTWSRNSTTTQTSVSKFGGSAATFVSGNNYLSLASGSATDFNFGTDDFSIDLWAYMTTLNASWNGLIAKLTGGANQAWLINVPTATGLVSANGTGWGAAGTTFTTNVWHHVALTRKAGMIYLFLDGALVASTLFANITAGTTSAVTIGRLEASAATGQFRGYMNEIRTMVGAARWVQSFTPPAAPSDYPVP